MSKYNKTMRCIIDYGLHHANYGTKLSGNNISQNCINEQQFNPTWYNPCCETLSDTIITNPMTKEKYKVLYRKYKNNSMGFFAIKELLD
jgi:hypothetical protein